MNEWLGVSFLFGLFVIVRPCQSLDSSADKVREVHEFIVDITGMPLYQSSRFDVLGISLLKIYLDIVICLKSFVGRLFQAFNW